MKIERIPLQKELTDTEFIVAGMLSHRYTAPRIARKLKVTERTARYYIHKGASKIPGDRPAQERIVAWYRGCTLQVLTGEGVD